MQTCLHSPMSSGWRKEGLGGSLDGLSLSTCLLPQVPGQEEPSCPRERTWGETPGAEVPPSPSAMEKAAREGSLGLSPIIPDPRGDSLQSWDKRKIRMLFLTPFPQSQ